MIMFVMINHFIMEDVKKHNLSFIKQTIDKESEYYFIAKDLVENLFFDMAKLCTKYDNSVFYDLPYTFSERCLDSVLLPALSKLCDSQVLVEYPVTRRSNRRVQFDDASGRIDYWCIYKGYSFVIELKHSFDCFTTNNTREDMVTSRWITMNDQLDSVKKEIKEFEEKTKGVIRIGLHIVTSYSDKEPDNFLIAQFKKSIPETFSRFQSDLAKPYRSLKPDLIICWKIPARIVLLGYQTFPGLWAIAKILPAIHHRGASTYYSEV